MPTGIELRPIYYALQFSGVLWRIIHVLKAFQPKSIEQLKSKSLCYHRDGSIDICDNPCKNSLNDCCLLAFYDYVEADDGNLFSLELKYEKVIKFADTLVSESLFDEEMVDRFYRNQTTWKLTGKGFNIITDPIVEDNNNREIWRTQYAKVRNEVSDLCWHIVSDLELNWTSHYRGILKDEILEAVYFLPGYLPERLHGLKKTCQGIFRDLCDNGGLNALSDHYKHICSLSEPHLRQLFTNKTDLFTESTIEDLLLYIVAIDIVFDFWTH